MKAIVKLKLWDSKNEKTEKTSSCSQFCTKNLFTTIAVLFGPQNNAGYGTIKYIALEAVL